MQPNQFKMIHEIFLRNYETAYPRGGLRIINGIKIRAGANATSLYDFSRISNFCKLNRDVFINIFSESQYYARTYDLIYLDVDDTSLEKALETTKRIVGKLRSHGHTEMIVICSASKGFHIYLPIKATTLNNYRVAVMSYLNNIGVEGYDPAVIEPKRVSRVPYTLNTKSGLYAVPVKDLNDTEAIWKSLKYGDAEPTTCGVNEALGASIKAFDPKEVKANSYEMVGYNKGVISDDLNLAPKCITEMLEAREVGHVGRILLCTYLLHAYKGDVQKVVEVFAKYPNFKQAQCEYQVNYIAERQLKFQSCTNIDNSGYCPLSEEAKQECYAYPNLNGLND